MTLGLIALDQAVKFWARTAAQGVEGHSLAVIWPNVFELKLVFNEGVAFGMLQGAGIYLTPVAVGIALLAGWYSWRHDSEAAGVHLTCALLASGSIGNLIDRVMFAKVTDMFWIRAINFPVFNVADVCITVAGAMFILGAIKEMGHKPKDPQPDATTLEEPT